MPRNLHRHFFIRLTLHAHAKKIDDVSYWLIGKYYNVEFWTYNWLGYHIADGLGILQHILVLLNRNVGDYFIDGVLYFMSFFITHHLDVVIDILQTPIHESDQRIWPDFGMGTLTSRQAYDILRSPLLRMQWAPWLWAPFIPQMRSTIVWSAIWRKLSTAYVIQRTSFPLCMASHETQEHILSECRFARSLFDSHFGIFHIWLRYDIGFSSLVLQAQHVI